MKKITTYAMIVLMAAYFVSATLWQVGQAQSTKTKEAQILFSGTGHDHSGGTNGNASIATDNTKVLKAGDTMTGKLRINGTATTALFIDHTGSTTSTAAVYITSNNSDGLSSGINSLMTGAGYAGYFSISLGANANDAVYGLTVGGGNGVVGKSTQTGAGVVGISDGTSLYSAAVKSQQIGRGWSLFVGTNDGANAEEVVYIDQTDGSGKLIYGNNKGTTTANLLELDHGSAEAFTVDADGDTSTPKTITAASGFIVANETLDVYDEGTWVPTYTGNTNAGNCAASATVALGYYTKIGNMVHADGNLVIPNCPDAPTGITLISLPFAANSGGAPGAGYVFGCALGYISDYALTVATDIMTAQGYRTTSYFTLYEYNGAGGAAVVAPIDTSFTLKFSCTYLTD